MTGEGGIAAEEKAMLGVSTEEAISSRQIEREGWKGRGRGRGRGECGEKVGSTRYGVWWWLPLRRLINGGRTVTSTDLEKKRWKELGKRVEIGRSLVRHDFQVPAAVGLTFDL